MYTIPQLPLNFELESRPVLKKLVQSHGALAELKGVTGIIPNHSILTNTLSLQEAKDSSEIENIITTQDELYVCDSTSNHFPSLAAKEVHNYALALRNGYEKVRKDKLLTNRDILDIQATIVESRAGFRTLPGTALKNEHSGEIVYTPPQSAEEVQTHLHNLEEFINSDSLCDLDSLTKMAVIHHQFESIHPFYDGNGRAGRMVNVLYLVKQNLLDTPILYLSRFINENKNEYYRLLQEVRENEQAWQDWILFMLEAVFQTSHRAIGLVHRIRDLMLHHKNKIRQERPKIYSQDLLNNLFRHPYTKTAFLASELQVHRNTAHKYLEELTLINLLTKHKVGKEILYVNDALFDLFQNL